LRRGRRGTPPTTRGGRGGPGHAAPTPGPPPSARKGRPRRRNSGRPSAAVDVGGAGTTPRRPPEVPRSPAGATDGSGGGRNLFVSLMWKFLRPWTAPEPLDGSRCWRRGGEVGAGWCRGARQESPFARRSHRWLRKGSKTLRLPCVEIPANVDDAAAICDAAAGVDVEAALGAWRARAPLLYRSLLPWTP